MNCKQGDLAIVVKADSLNFGRLVRILRPWINGEEPRWSESEFLWFVESVGAPLIVPDGFHKGLRTKRPFADSSLRPIRDPGDAAEDETLSWLPAPSKEAA